VVRVIWDRLFFSNGIIDGSHAQRSILAILCVHDLYISNLLFFVLLFPQEFHLSIGLYL